MKLEWLCFLNAFVTLLINIKIYGLLLSTWSVLLKVLSGVVWSGRVSAGEKNLCPLHSCTNQDSATFESDKSHGSVVTLCWQWSLTRWVYWALNSWTWFVAQIAHENHSGKFTYMCTRFKPAPQQKEGRTALSSWLSEQSHPKCDPDLQLPLVHVSASSQLSANTHWIRKCLLRSLSAETPAAHAAAETVSTIHHCRQKAL